MDRIYPSELLAEASRDVILVSRHQLNLLYRGAIATVTATDLDYRRGRVYSVWLDLGKDDNNKQVRRKVCRVQVVKREGSELSILFVPDAEPRFLAANYLGDKNRPGYTSRPHLGAAGEPEALSVVEQNAISKPLSERDDELRRERVMRERRERMRSDGSVRGV